MSSNGEHMLEIRESIPDGLLDLDAAQLHSVLRGPTLFHLPGKKVRPLFVSVLLHGNETSGWEAMRQVLRLYDGRDLPRALSLLIGNVEAARSARRHLDEQPDYNRVWNPGTSREHGAMALVVDEMRRREVLYSIDIHNNTGHNPHYGCINSLDGPYLQLARLFSRNIVYFLRPDSVQSMAFAKLCPAVTVECGRAEYGTGAEHAAEFVAAILNISALPNHPISTHDIDVFHTVATVKLHPDCRFTFGRGNGDLSFEPGLERLNFAEVESDTLLATRLTEFADPLIVIDESGAVVTGTYFNVDAQHITFRRNTIPAMITSDVAVIRQDCLCYLMERYPWQGRD